MRNTSIAYAHLASRREAERGALSRLKGLRLHKALRRCGAYFIGILGYNYTKFSYFSNKICARYNTRLKGLRASLERALRLE